MVISTTNILDLIYDHDDDGALIGFAEWFTFE